MRCLTAAKCLSPRVSGSFSLCEALQRRDGIADVLGLCCGQGRDEYTAFARFLFFFFFFPLEFVQRFLVFYCRCAGAT